jgi:hypothetical protein
MPSLNGGCSRPLARCRAKKKWSPRGGRLAGVVAVSKDKNCREKSTGRPRGGWLGMRIRAKIPYEEREMVTPGVGCWPWFSLHVPSSALVVSRHAFLRRALGNGASLAKTHVEPRQADSGAYEFCCPKIFAHISAAGAPNPTPRNCYEERKWSPPGAGTLPKPRRRSSLPDRKVVTPG